MEPSRVALMAWLTDTIGQRRPEIDPRFQPALRLAAAALGGISVLVVAAALLTFIS